MVHVKKGKVIAGKAKTMDRVILHCDCNSFFASVESAINPEYKKVPLAVCGEVENRHGIVLAKNDLAKAFGVKTTETVYSARKKCPKLVVVQPHYELYAEYSRRANEIYSRYTDMIEPFGIDESWLDVTASEKIFGNGYEIAKKISSDIKRELGITVSIGVSFNKVFAKLGSDYKKPDAITVIDRSNYKDIVYKLPASDMLFVGKKTAEMLWRMGIRTIGDLANVDLDLLVSHFGKAGKMLYDYSRGLDDSPVSSHDDKNAKSISASFTFKRDLLSFEECRVGLEYLCEEIASKLRDRGLLSRTVQIAVKDEKLNVSQKQMACETPTDISDEISKTALQLLYGFWSEGRPVRMLSVTATSLIKSDVCSSQITLFDDGSADREKCKKREKTIDEIRQKYGRESIIKGAMLNSDIGIYKAPEKKN